MATFFYHGEISQQQVVDLIKKIDECPDMDIDLYFSSGGGDLAMATVLVDYINTSIKDVTLIAHWHIISAALFVLFEAVCEKRLLPDAYGGFHLATRDSNMRELMDGGSYDTFLVQVMNKTNVEILEKYGSFFTEDELTKVRNGGTIYMHHDRFEQFFNEYANKYIPPPDEEAHEDIS